MVTVVACQCRFGADTAVRDAALAGAAFRRILKNRGIDLSHAEYSLAEAAQRARTPLPQLLDDLTAGTAAQPENCRIPDWRRLGRRELVDFLRRRHHRHLAAEPVFLEALFRKTLDRNQADRSRRERLYRIFTDFTAALAAHQEREERGLFAAITAGANDWQLEQETAALTAEHRLLMKELLRLRCLSHALTTGGRCDPALALLTESLPAFLDACEEHFFWENCLLFPGIGHPAAQPPRLN